MNVLKYSKAIVAGIAAVLIVVTSAMTGAPLDVASIVAIAGALGVFAVPNAGASK